MSSQPQQSDLHQAIQRLVQKETAATSARSDSEFPMREIVSSNVVSGGCISDAKIVTLSDGQRLFVKSNQRVPGLFTAEAEGLAAIALTESIQVPNVVGVGKTESGLEFIVLEVIETGRPDREFEAQFGRSLATMHRYSNARFGFHLNNYLGRTPQINQWTTDWREFWAVHRLGYQLSLAQDNGYATKEFNLRCDRIIDKLGTLLSGDDEPSLIHGDLWSGNFMVSETGQPVLIDPAVYFGSREAEFGMTTLFGGFGPRFYDAYQESWPLKDGWQERVEIYRLYHLLNHLNLFGSTYFGQCMDVMNKFI